MSVSDFLSLYFILLLAFVVSGIALATVETVRHSRNEYTDFGLIGDWIKALLRRGYDGGYLTLGHAPSRQILQFRKYIRGAGDYGLELRCLGLDWSDGTLHAAGDAAEAAGLPLRVEPLDVSGGSRNGLVVDCGQDSAAASEIARSIWIGIFGLVEDTQFKALRGDWSAVGELIDGPDHPPPLESLPPEEQLGELDARLRKEGMPGVLAMMVAAILTVLALITGIGLPIEMLVSRGEPPDWSVRMGVVDLQGSLASLIYLVVLVSSVLGIKMLKMPRRQDTWGKWDRRHVWLGRAIAVGLPFAMFLAWAGY
ncbi:MAG: hypothetical protein HKM95_00200 [Inquilinus sp.]|nr:hypothetical protein [Inquilinus sp.]